MLPAKRGRALVSPAHRVGLSSPIDSARTRGSPAATWSASTAWSRVGPVLRQSVFSASIDVQGERTGREMVKCRPGDISWIGGQCLAGGHVQAEPVGLLALPAGGHAWLHPSHATW